MICCFSSSPADWCAQNFSIDGLGDDDFDDDAKYEDAYRDKLIFVYGARESAAAYLEKIKSRK